MSKLLSKFKRHSKGKVHISATESDADTIKHITGPTDFKHNLHVGFDSIKGDFTGLPPAWDMWLKTSNINTSTNIPTTSDQSSDDEGDSESEHAAGAEMESTSVPTQSTNQEVIPESTSSTGTRRNKRKTSTKDDDPVAKEVLAYIAKKSEPEDEDRLFLLSLVPAFRRLPPQKKSLLKIKFLEDLNVAEFGDHANDHSVNNCSVGGWSASHVPQYEVSDVAQRGSPATDTSQVYWGTPSYTNL